MDNIETKKTKIKFNIMAIVLITFFCFAFTPVTFQNDTFYTIKIGEHIVNNGIDMHDPFSYHNLKYTYPHWLYDVMMYLIYSIGGEMGIYISTIFFAIILGITIYITNVKLSKCNISSFIITIGSIYMLKDFIAARAQLVTFILFILTVYCIEQFLDTKKRKYAILLIIIPILIANLHVAVFPFYFVLYLPYIAEYLLCTLSEFAIIKNKYKIKNLDKKAKETNEEEKILEFKNEINKLIDRNTVLAEKRKNRKNNAYKITTYKNPNIRYLLIIFIITIFAGFITPIGTTPYTYLIKTMQGTTTANISEHLPLTLKENTNYAIVLVLFLLILIFTDTKIRLCDLFMVGGLTALTFYSRRQESIFIIICGFILNRLITSLFNKYDKYGPSKIEKSLTGFIGMIITSTTVLSICIINYKPKLKDKFVDEKQYPVYAADYIINHLDINNIRLYNEYNYGSYLLFKGIPVFVDSRADLYSPEFNEGVTVFDDFIKISGLKTNNIEKKFQKYGFTHFIINRNSELRIVLRQNEDKYKQIYDDGNFIIYENLQTY